MKYFKKILKYNIIILLILFLAFIGVYLYAYFSPKLNIDTSNQYTFYDINNNTYNNDSWVKLNEISPNLINATISVEDKNFYHHDGFDTLRIIKAMFTNLVHKDNVEGASTITQQYAKNLFLDFDKTWKRKLSEAWLTIRLETHYSKDEILEGYLNTINYGGVFGISNASKYYFDKEAKDLTLAEATILAGIPKSPSNYSPLSNESASKDRQKIILNSMVKNKYISKEVKDIAYNTKLVYKGESDKLKGNSVMYYEDAVLKELKEIKTIPSSFLSTGGLKIYTNLDIKAQELLEKNVKDNVKDNKDIEVASIVMDSNSGNVLALIGGRDYTKSEYNRAVSSKRQVGSTIKPFLYYAALENGFTPSTTFISEKTMFTFSDNKTYSPQNYGDTYPNKAISMAAAIAYSDNIFAVKTHVFLGEETLVNMAKRLGITSKLEANPSLALGSCEVSLMEMMGAYGAFASGGYKVKPHLINKVLDKDGNILYSYNNEKEVILNESLVYVLNEMLTNTYSKNFIDYTYPTLINYTNKINKKLAVKTGTTETDRLIFGYNKDILVGVWTGYDDNRETPSSDRQISQNIWVNTMEEYLYNKEDNWYQMPSNVIATPVNPISGTLASKKDKKQAILYYIKGTEPSNNEPLDSLVPTVKIE